MDGLDAIRVVLAAYRSTDAHITQEQIEAAWGEFDELRAVLSQEPVEIARCPVHGLHGARAECFVCGAPVERVPMVAVRPSSSQQEGGGDGR